ncbi:hypothetical protein GCM10020295_03220 [Streptomyces cinereospinus]
MYLTEDASAATLRQIAGLAPGSTLVMTFLLPTELVDAADRPGLRQARFDGPARTARRIAAYHSTLKPGHWPTGWTATLAWRSSAGTGQAPTPRAPDAAPPCSAGR